MLEFADSQMLAVSGSPMLRVREYSGELNDQIASKQPDMQSVPTIIMRPKKSSPLNAVLHCGLILFAMLAVNASGFAQSSDLPELGDNADKYLNPNQEKHIGQAFLRRLLIDKHYVEDDELLDYLQSIGDHIAATADLRGMRLTFNLLQNNTLNAFAVPGGYITFNTGLISTTDTESELASVVAHETAHLTQRHLPRLVARSSENKIPALAAIIGSILVGGQAGLAGITATTATLASNQLSFTREFEREADAIGIKLLADAHYDPNGMASFFGKLERYTRHDNTQIPEFLRTHPLSYTRIAESEARAGEYPDQNHRSSFEYHLAKAKIQALYTKHRDDPKLYFADQLKSDQAEIRDAAIYGTAIALTASRNYDKARVALAPLLERHPDNLWIQSARAKIDLADNKAARAINRYQALVRDNSHKTYLNYYLANAYLANNQPHLAKKVIRYQIRRNPGLYRLYALLSKTNAAQGNLAEAHQADAEYHATLGNYKGAIESLKLAQREAAAEGYLAKSIAARLAELEEKQALQKKMGAYIQ